MRGDKRTRDLGEGSSKRIKKNHQQPHKYEKEPWYEQFKQLKEKIFGWVTEDTKNISTDLVEEKTGVEVEKWSIEVEELLEKAPEKPKKLWVEGAKEELHVIRSLFGSKAMISRATNIQWKHSQMEGQIDDTNRSKRGGIENDDPPRKFLKTQGRTNTPYVFQKPKNEWYTFAKFETEGDSFLYMVTGKNKQPVFLPVGDTEHDFNKATNWNFYDLRTKAKSNDVKIYGNKASPLTYQVLNSDYVEGEYLYDTELCAIHTADFYCIKCKVKVVSAKEIKRIVATKGSIYAVYDDENPIEKKKDAWEVCSTCNKCVCTVCQADLGQYVVDKSKVLELSLRNAPHLVKFFFWRMENGKHHKNLFWKSRIFEESDRHKLDYLEKNEKLLLGPPVLKQYRENRSKILLGDIELIEIWQKREYRAINQVKCITKRELKSKGYYHDDELQFIGAYRLYSDLKQTPQKRSKQLGLSVNTTGSSAHFKELAMYMARRNMLQAFFRRFVQQRDYRDYEYFCALPKQEDYMNFFTKFDEIEKETEKPECPHTSPSTPEEETSEALVPQIEKEKLIGPIVNTSNEPIDLLSYLDSDSVLTYPEENSCYSLAYF